MSWFTGRIPASIAVLALALAVDAPSAVRAEESCVTPACHPKIITGKTVHAVAGNCETCHESIEKPHPKKGGKTFKLSQDVPDLCYTCHEAFTDKKTVHPPVEQGLCTTCHNPHASDEPKLLAQPMKDLCGMCHSDHEDFPVVHGPVAAGDCTACHTPHASDDKSLLLEPDEKLCFQCHKDMEGVEQKAHVHPALAGGCTSCHNPHGSPQPKLLAEEGRNVCFTCHPDISEKVRSAPVAHPPAQDPNGCVTCHSPHASDNEKMLKDPEKETCLRCHSTILSKDMTVVHGPIQQGHCTACHDVHGADHPKLLTGTFPTEIYVPYTDDEYGLCFSCHKRDLVRYPETSFATGFRDGERNLHYLHVHKDVKGRSCRLCHNLHGGKNPKLIADTVPFGKWNLPLNFTKTDTGGSCAPGCHKPQSYDRETPGKKPPPPAKPEGKPAAPPAS